MEICYPQWNVTQYDRTCLLRSDQTACSIRPRRLYLGNNVLAQSRRQLICVRQSASVCDEHYQRSNWKKAGTFPGHFFKCFQKRQVGVGSSPPRHGDPPLGAPAVSARRLVNMFLPTPQSQKCHLI